MKINNEFKKLISEIESYVNRDKINAEYQYIVNKAKELKINQYSVNLLIKSAKESIKPQTSKINTEGWISLEKNIPESLIHYIEKVCNKGYIDISEKAKIDDETVKYNINKERTESYINLKLAEGKENLETQKINISKSKKIKIFVGLFFALIIILAIVTVTIIVFVFPNLKEKEEWNYAIQKNSTNSYQTYIIKFPDGKFVYEANELIKKIEIDSINTVKLEIQSTVMNWIDCWQNKDLTCYSKYISDDYMFELFGSGNKQNRTTRLSTLSEHFSTRSFIHIIVENIKIENLTNNEAIVSYYQKYSSDIYSDESNKIIYLKLINNNWSIYRDTSE